MSSFLIVLYTALLVIALCIFLFYFLSLRARKKSVGRIQSQWSLFFNFSFWVNRWVFTAFSAYFLWCVYQIVTDPKSSNGYHRLMILVFVLSFTPRWNVYVGSEGVLFRMKFIPWERVIEKKIIHRGKNRYLEITGTLGSGLSKEKTISLPVPKNISPVFLQKISSEGCMKITL